MVAEPVLGPKACPDLRGLRQELAGIASNSRLCPKACPDLRGLRHPDGVCRLRLPDLSEGLPRFEGIETEDIECQSAHSTEGPKACPDLRGLRPIDAKRSRTDRHASEGLPRFEGIET